MAIGKNMGTLSHTQAICDGFCISCALSGNKVSQHLMQYAADKGHARRQHLGGNPCPLSSPEDTSGIRTPGLIHVMDGNVA